MVEVKRRIDDQRDTDHRRVVLEHDIQAGVVLGVDSLRPRDAIEVNGCGGLDCAGVRKKARIVDCKENAASDSSRFVTV